MKNLKQIITGLITTGKASLKEIAFFLGQKRHDKVWREIRKMGKEKGYMTMVKMALKMLREREGMEIHLVIDDTVLDKQWGRKTEWAYYLYSGRYGKVIRGIGMVVLMVRVGEWKIPIGFRIYRRKEDGKTRIDLAMEMLRWAIEEEGIRPDAVEMDSWYASKKILKYLLGKGGIHILLCKEVER
jgi:SRSO17 transposase